MFWFLKTAPQWDSGVVLLRPFLGKRILFRFGCSTPACQFKADVIGNLVQYFHIASWTAWDAPKRKQHPGRIVSVESYTCAKVSVQPFCFHFWFQRPPLEIKMEPTSRLVGKPCEEPEVLRVQKQLQDPRSASPWCFESLVPGPDCNLGVSTFERNFGGLWEPKRQQATTTQDRFARNLRSRSGLSGVLKPTLGGPLGQIPSP